MNRNDDQPSGFFDELRRVSPRGPGRGLRRVARLARGGSGLARKMFRAARKGEPVAPTPREIARIEKLVKQLGELKGLPMKFGQIMSYLDMELPVELQGMLALLQTQSPATPRELVAQVVREDLGERAESLWASLGQEPISIASIGQVYRGRLPDGREVAVKVRHPEIEQAMRADFRFASLGTGIAGMLVPGMGGTARDFVAEIEARLLEECDYLLEAERQRLFGRLFAGHPLIRVPEVHDDWCGPRVLTTSWDAGDDLTTFVARASQRERDDAGRVLFEFYIGTLYRHGLFHADPHPGNYHFCRDGKVVVFDYGCVRVFEPEVAEAFRRLAAAVRHDDRDQICAALEGLGAAPSTHDKTYSHLRKLLRSFFAPMLEPGPHRIDGKITLEMGQIMRDKLALARLRLSGRLMFLFRIRFGLYAVLARIGAEVDWAQLEQSFVGGSPES